MQTISTVRYTTEPHRTAKEKKRKEKRREYSTYYYLYLLESVLVGPGDVAAIALREHQETLMPQHWQNTCLGRESHEVIDQSVYYLRIAWVGLGWVGLGWVGLGWVGLGGWCWVVLGGVGVVMGGVGWCWMVLDGLVISPVGTPLSTKKRAD